MPNLALPKKSTTWVKTYGLDCCTIYNNKPYFFLFADIDTKDKEALLKVLTIFCKRNLSCYHYETTKGYHVISPTMLTVREWVNYKRALSYLEYRFDTIRISKRVGDGKKLFYNHYNKHFRRMESKSFHNLFRNLFGYSEIENNLQIVSTILQYTTYMQLKLKNNAMYGVGESLSSPSGFVKNMSCMTLCPYCYEELTQEQKKNHYCV